MIKLDKDYAINADVNCFMLQKKLFVTDKETGEKVERYVSFKYCTTLESVLETYCKIKLREKIASKDMELKDVKKEIENLHAYIKSLNVC